MLPPPPARCQYAVLIRALARLRASGRDRGMCRVRTMLMVGVGVRVWFGFKGSVGVQRGQNFLLGGHGAHVVSTAFGVYRLVRTTRLATYRCLECP